MTQKKFITTLGAGGVALGALNATGETKRILPETKPAAAPLSPLVLADLLNLDDVEAYARTVLPAAVYEFVASGAADELTLRWNREKYHEIRLQQSVLRDLAGLDCATTLLGQKMPTPILLAPTASQMLSHPEGELATARGAGVFGATMVLSAGSNVAIEEVMAVASAPVWFQLYVSKDRAHSKALVERVQAAGVKALCVTVDSPLDGPRNRQMRTPVKLPPGVHHPHYVGIRERIPAPTLDRVEPANLLWRDIEWLRSFTRVPLLLKGVMNPADAIIGLQAGADGIIVSNHGARCLDTQPASIEALPRVVDAVAGRAPVLVDGGIRRGTDVLKALALGATAVLIGRPYVYGLASGGAEGVAHVLKLLRQELWMAMALTGCPTITAIDRKVIWK